MATEQASSESGGLPDVIPPGTLVGGRFRVERSVRRDALSTILFARDEKTLKPIAIRVLGEAFTGDKSAFEAIRDEIKTSARIKHRALVAIYGVGTHDVATHFVACEWVQGTTVSEFLRRRLEAGKPLSARGIYNIVAHVCKALDAVHVQSHHGALRPSIVWITKSGRVKLDDLGVGATLVRSGKWRLLDEYDRAFLAPEVRAGAGADARSDVWSVGALLYALATGAPPAIPASPLAGAHPEATEELDAIVRRCLATKPAERWGTVHEIAEALLPLVAEAQESASDEFGVDLEIDVDIAMSMVPHAPEPPPVPSVNPLSIVPEIAESAPPRPPGVVDFSDLMSKLAKDDAPRWMAVKGGLDHGPFTVRELVKLIVEGEILAEHPVLNMDSNERKPLMDYPEFSEFVEQYRIRKAEHDHAAALVKSTKIEKRGNVAKFFVAAGVLGVLLVGTGAYVVSRQAAQKRALAAEVDLASLFESGQVKITGTADILKAPRGRGGGARRAGGIPGPGGGSTGFTSYDDAMNQAMELNMNQAGGERQLTSADVAGVMNQKLNSLFGCVSQELRGGSRLGTVRIDLAIQGSGQVMGASVNTGSASFKGCIAGKVRQIRFPSFPAPRMGARYSFDVD